MRTALRAKLRADPSLATLLRPRHPQTNERASERASERGASRCWIKQDMYWGFDPMRGGRNRLAELWMELREELPGLRLTRSERTDARSDPHPRPTHPHQPSTSQRVWLESTPYWLSSLYGINIS